MNCPKCQVDCWDNTEENKTRKAEGKKERPQYSCKDKEGCGWIMWSDKPGTKTELREHKPTPLKAILTPDNHLSQKTMLMSYAKDVVVKRIEVGLAEPGDSANQIISIYRSLCSEVFNPLK